MKERGAAEKRPESGGEGFISRDEVARRLKKSPRTVGNWMRRGIIPYYKVGRWVGFRWEEVEERIRERFRIER